MKCETFPSTKFLFKHLFCFVPIIFILFFRNFVYFRTFVYFTIFFSVSFILSHAIQFYHQIHHSYGKSFLISSITYSIALRRENGFMFYSILQPNKPYFTAFILSLLDYLQLSYYDSNFAHASF